MDCPKQRRVKQERGPWSKGWLGPPTSTNSSTDTHPGSRGAPVNNNTKHPSYWNDDPRAHWLGPLNVGYAIIDEQRERVLIDSGAWTNAVMSTYAKKHKLRVGLVHELALHPILIPISSIGGHAAALRYVIINIQIEGIPSYKEEQVALVILSVTLLGMKVPVILGTPTIHHLCCQMKESELHTAPEEWQHTLLSYEVAQNVSIHAMMPETGVKTDVEYPTNTGQNPMDLDKPVLLKDRVTIPAFASQIVHV